MASIKVTTFSTLTPRFLHAAIGLDIAPPNTSPSTSTPIMPDIVLQIIFVVSPMIPLLSIILNIGHVLSEKIERLNPSN
jgi:hypothetical protein